MLKRYNILPVNEVKALGSQIIRLDKIIDNLTESRQILTFHPWESMDMDKDRNNSRVSNIDTISLRNIYFFYKFRCGRDKSP